MHRPVSFWPAALLFAGASFCLPVGAQSMKPGLWEISTHMTPADKDRQNAMAKMQQQMASMPPAQRKQMEAVMAQRGMALDGQGGMRVKSCVTPEQAAHSEVPTQRGNCKTTPAVRSGNTMHFSYQCTDPIAQGESSVTFTSPTAYTMHGEHTMTVDGTTQKTVMDAEGRWLNDDCTGAMNAPRKQ